MKNVAVVFICVALVVVIALITSKPQAGQAYTQEEVMIRCKVISGPHVSTSQGSNTGAYGAVSFMAKAYKDNAAESEGFFTYSLVCSTPAGIWSKMTNFTGLAALVCYAKENNLDIEMIGVISGYTKDNDLDLEMRGVSINSSNISKFCFRSISVGPNSIVFFPREQWKDLRRTSD